MEWYNLNLTNYRQKIWLKTAYRNLILFGITALIALLIAGFLWLTSCQIQQNFYQNQQQIERLNNQLQQTEQQIQQRKAQQSQQITPTHLTKKELADFLHYLSHFSIKGILENSQLYSDENSNENAKIKIVGNIQQQSDLEQITEQLKQQNRSYKLDYLQRNEQQQFEFSLTIPLQENSNEKLDP